MAWFGAFDSQGRKILYCAACLELSNITVQKAAYDEINDDLDRPWQPFQAITIFDGKALCEDHLQEYAEYKEKN